MEFQLADESQDAGLRQMLGRSPMPGWIRISFDREPSFFHAAGIQGKQTEVITAVDGAHLVGMGCRSIKPMFVNGEKMELGYLGGLRLEPEARGTGAMARGYGALKRLHDKRPVPAYLSTVVESNLEAKNLLTSGRAGLPVYTDKGRYLTYAINLGSRRSEYSSQIQVRGGDDVGLPRLLGFLSEEGRRRQFFPALESGDFGSGYLRGLKLSDFRVALDAAGKVIGAAAAWDQSSFKQNRVHGYSRGVRCVSPLLNACLRGLGYRPLPEAGESLEIINVAFACVKDEEPAIMRALLERIYRDNGNGRYQFMMIGFHESDPHIRIMSRFFAFRYVSRFYLVSWDDGYDFVKALDPRRIPYLDVSTL